MTSEYSEQPRRFLCGDPDKNNLPRAHGGAVLSASLISMGLPFPCPRHGGVVACAECVAMGKKLCNECATGDLVRKLARERCEPQQEVEDVAEKKQKLIDCPGCHRHMKEQARGHCARCYAYVLKGEPIPPLEFFPGPSATEEPPANDPAPSDAACAGAGPPTVPLEEIPGAHESDPLPGWLHSEIARGLRLDELSIDMGRCVELELISEDDLADLLDRVRDYARKRRRTIEAQVLLAMEAYMAR